MTTLIRDLKSSNYTTVVINYRGAVFNRSCVTPIRAGESILRAALDWTFSSIGKIQWEKDGLLEHLRRMILSGVE